MQLSEAQEALVQGPLNARIFLHGPAGSGKSTVGVSRLRHLLSAGVPGSSILVLAPQRTLQDPYLAAARSPDIGAGTEVDAVTIGGLARRLCDLFWPLAAQKAGFRQPERPPFFLTLESSQYYMSHLVRPLLDKGYFQSVTMDRNRLYSQILDSLNKSAAVGFPHTDLGSRLDSAWYGDQAQRRIYAEAQECASVFRQFCLEHNLLDFSLQLQMFWQFLWPDPFIRNYLQRSYRHIIYDNVEEDVPRAHDTVREWMPDFDSALLIYDDDAGYRRFLGADVETGWALRETCQAQHALHQSFVMSAAIAELALALDSAIREPAALAPGTRRREAVGRHANAARLISSRFYPELLDQVSDRVAALVADEGVHPSEIAIVGPYMSDALRFAITSRFEARGIPVKTHRPSRSLRDEPAAQALLTLASLAHPHWDRPPARFDVARAFMKTLSMDLVRAHLLAEIVFRKGYSLSSFDEINPEMQDRITYVHGAAYSRLREWLLSYREGDQQPLDHFLRRIFGEVLSQPGFGFHEGFDDARIAGNLVESIRKFRLAMQPSFDADGGSEFDVGREYLALLYEGLLAAQYLESWKPASQAAVLVAPAHSFLMMNRPVAIQFWLDTGSGGWFELLDQPLTHTRVLSRTWPADQKWTFIEEERLNLDGLLRLTTGLLRRCRQVVYLCVTQLGESGFEQRGRLLLALNQVLHESNSVSSS
jgi:hypothetical protein